MSVKIKRVIIRRRHVQHSAALYNHSYRTSSVKGNHKHMNWDLYNEFCCKINSQESSHSAQTNLTVLELVEKYVAIKINARETTRAGYKTVVNLLKKDEFGSKYIDTVRISDAKLWFIKLQREDGKGFSTIHSIRGVLKPAFQLAVDDDYIEKNPFAFDLSSVIVNDSATRESISRKDEKRFLEFIKSDSHYSIYYEGIYILFNTGLRILLSVKLE